MCELAILFPEITENPTCCAAAASTIVLLTDNSSGKTLFELDAGPLRIFCLRIVWTIHPAARLWRTVLLKLYIAEYCVKVLRKIVMTLPRPRVTRECALSVKKSENRGFIFLFNCTSERFHIKFSYNLIMVFEETA